MLTFAAAVLALTATSAIAQDGVPPLNQCEGLYTVQKRQCAVEHVYRCNTDIGTVFRYDEWEQADETLSIEVTTQDGDFLTAWDEDGSFIITGRTEVRNAMSAGGLLKIGEDAFDMTVMAQMAGVDDPVEIVISGQSKLSDTDTVLDGVTFRQARNTFAMDVFGQRFEGFEMVLVDVVTGAVVGGEAQFAMGNGDLSTSGAPVNLIFPGEPGFLENEAQHDCAG